MLCTVNNKYLKIPDQLLTEVKKIEVYGLPLEDNIEIKEKLKNLLFKNIFFIRSDRIKEIISRYNSVEKFRVIKSYPHNIIIEIEPTKFVAKIKSSNSYLVGSNGKLISKKNINNDLPLLFGEFDAKEFLKFKKKIDSSQFEMKDFKSIFFFPSKRWDVYTNNNILIKFPEIDLSEALTQADKIIKSNKFINKGTIDLRIANHIIIKNE